MEILWFAKLCEFHFAPTGKFRDMLCPSNTQPRTRNFYLAIYESLLHTDLQKRTKLDV
jgi:hypothetical protein